MTMLPKPPEPDVRTLSGWFAGPKAENGEWFADTIRRIIQDYHSWRRNYFPGDGVVVDSHLRRLNEPFQDAFEDRLLELLARLKGDFPFHSPRYAGHMIAEQSLPAIAGYLAAMLYNPNNVTASAAPVTVRLELEAAQLIARMLGYGAQSWAHLTGGGTVANIEALWIARTVKFLPLVVRDMRRQAGLAPLPWPDEPAGLLRLSPDVALHALDATFQDAIRRDGRTREVTARLVGAYLNSRFNVVERGVAAVQEAVGAAPVVLIPETHHYSFEKAMDVLGLGRCAIIPVRVGSDFRMEVSDLGARLDEAEDRGAAILAVVAVVGSTEEGAVDPVDEVLNLRARREAAGFQSFWIHADAAYGGYLRTMTVPYRVGLGDSHTEVKVAGRVRPLSLQLPERTACDALERLGECDSITVDPHKLGYIPYPAGAACFKSNLVKPIARQDAPYMEDAPSDVETEATSDSIGLYILEGSKPGAAAAAVWLAHTLIPLDVTGHGVLVRETVRNACELHALLESYPGMVPEARVRAVCLCPPGSNIVCFAFRPGRGPVTLARLNAVNERIYRRFTLRESEGVYAQSFFLSRTVLTASRYSPGSVSAVLERLGVDPADYPAHGLFLLRSVLMNPWYTEAKRRGRFLLSELAAEVYAAADAEWASHLNGPGGI